MLPVAFLLLLTAIQAGSQPPAPPEQSPVGEPRPDAEYMIGPEDILRITVYGHDDLTQVVLVQTDGTFTYPLIGRVKASDLTTPELEKKIAILLARGFIRNPQVTVVVQEYRSKTVFVVGEVARPGPYPLAGRTGLVEVLAKAGMTGNAGAEVVVVRPPAGSRVSGPILPEEVGETKGEKGEGASGEASGDATEEEAAEAPRAEVFRIDVREIQTGHLEKNLVLQPNDTVFVPQAPKVFVTGEVKNPGAYGWSPGLTARQLISLAGGLTPDGSDGRLRIVRPPENEGGKSKEDRIKLDEPVQPGETLVVRRRLF